MPVQPPAERPGGTPTRTDIAIHGRRWPGVVNRIRPALQSPVYRTDINRSLFSWRGSHQAMPKSAPAKSRSTGHVHKHGYDSADWIADRKWITRLAKKLPRTPRALERERRGRDSWRYVRLRARSGHSQRLCLTADYDPQQTPRIIVLMSNDGAEEWRRIGANRYISRTVDFASARP